MPISVTILADGPAGLAEVWALLRPHLTGLDIVGDELFIEVDLTKADDSTDQDDDPDGQVEVEAAPQLEVVEDDPQPEPDADDRDADDEPDPANLDGQILAILDDDPMRRFTVADLRLALPTRSEGGIRSTLSTLLTAGRIEKVDRGVYRSRLVHRAQVEDARRAAAAEAL